MKGSCYLLVSSAGRSADKATMLVMRGLSNSRLMPTNVLQYTLGVTMRLDD